ncbi:MAG: CRISPR-associated endoribonuclease Cas6 [Methanosphaera stadtmanae]|nr:CRISPR-associated endoribonuclease Cas6 [Methanosphaera stadtmanae]
MRLKLYLTNENGIINVPFNYNHILSSIIYGLMEDIDYANKLHAKSTFKYFCFSRINISQRKMIDGGFISKNGKISFIISSPDDRLITELVNGIINQSEINFIGQILKIVKCEIIKQPKFSSKMEFITLSPIIVTTKREVDGKLREWDLAPSEEFYRGIENNLIKKYLKFNNLESTDKTINVYSNMKSVKRKRITINKGENTTYHRAYNMDLVLDGDVDLIKFAYDCGISSKNSQGFGLVDIYH